MAGFDAYRTGLRNYVRGLWTDALTKEQFLGDTRTLINRRLMQAWLEGAAKCGITEEDMSDEEWKAIGEIIKNELEYLPGLAADVVKQNKKAGGKLEPFFSRVDTWANRYPDVVNRAQVMACADDKSEWILGPTEHCSTCSKLAGRVKRNSFWRKNVMPKSPPNPKLECEGWECGCNLRKTNKPVSRGKLPSLP